MFYITYPKVLKKKILLGISLLSCAGKLYSSILSNRIVLYSNICNILADEQNGFRKNRSCSDHYLLCQVLLKIYCMKINPHLQPFWTWRKLSFTRIWY